MRLLIIFFSVFLFSKELHITSEKFFYNSKLFKSVFIGDVNATEGNNYVLAKKMIVFFNKNRKPIKYEAIGNVKFKFILDNNSTIIGRSDKLIYNFNTYDILLEGNAFVKKIETNESIKASFIKVNRKTKSMEVKGNKKPANIVIKVDNES